MPQSDPRVDAYIAKAAPFARPILAHLRELVHRAEPGIAETIKWGMPFFECAGIVCHMAAFKAHCAFGLWRGGPTAKTGKKGEAMGHFGRITALADLPPDAAIVKLVRAAIERNRSGEKVPVKPKAPRAPIAMTAELRAALAKNRVAKATFDGFSPSQQRDYLEWITEAKTAATRDKRIATAIEWLAEGKPRDWKYRRE
jgi:hypothetical protein